MLSLCRRSPEKELPKCAEEKNTKKDDGSKWRAHGSNNKRADSKIEVKEGQLHTMFISSGDHTSRTYFSDPGEDNEFTWHQFHVEGWGARYFEGHTSVSMHNTTSHVLPLTWLFLDSQLTVDLIASAKMLVKIRKVWVEDAIRVHCNCGINIVNRVGDVPGYGTAWYEPTGFANVDVVNLFSSKIRSRLSYTQFMRISQYLHYSCGY